MKKAAIILSIIALIAVSCGQAKKRETKIIAENNAQSINAQQYQGIYTFGNIESKNSETRQGEVYIYPKADSTFLFYLFICKGAPSYNMGALDGKIIISNGQAIFKERSDYEEADCVLKFEFKENALTVTEDDVDCGCGFGGGVYVNDTFQRTSSEIPKYYTNMENDTIYFSELKEEDSTITDKELVE